MADHTFFLICDNGIKVLIGNFCLKNESIKNGQYGETGISF